MVAAEEEEVAPSNENERIMQKNKFFKTIAPLSFGLVGACYAVLKVLMAFFFLSDVSSDTVELIIYGNSGGFAVVQFFTEMIIKGVHSRMDKLARQRFYIFWSFLFLFYFATLPFLWDLLLMFIVYS